MKKSLKSRVCLVILTSTLLGCVTQPPSEITLKDAMRQLQEGIDELQRPEDAGKKKAGLVVSEIEVVFNVMASAKNTSELSLDLSPEKVVKAIPSGSLTVGSERSEGRSNQITIKFLNVLLAPKDSILGNLALSPGQGGNGVGASISNFVDGVSDTVITKSKPSTPHHK